MIYNFFYILLKGGTFIIYIIIATIITTIPIVNATLFLNQIIILSKIPTYSNLSLEWVVIIPRASILSTL